ncbi:tryptophan--tRNA ligase [Nocardioides mangrovi]|uniref:Tryptophan--tRNA ligase n=1 Tax=Nocardioides mangrovi TaxID=2874580 RepID=A0ABS7UE49_9ACTN|nr:tryptophan--tRNA ligase [Nocardioides mangrovi]MBZ5739271.1 tryptophan--tRNA ligase [Nocardioides mangrovi]
MTTLSLLTPSGRLTLGNLLGALRPMAARQEDAYYGLSDLHAMTTTHDPAVLRERTTEMATLLLAVGLDRATLFRQSRVPAHAELAYLLECTAYTGELNRMIQFKEKGGRVGPTPSRASSSASPAKAEEGGGTESRRPTTTQGGDVMGGAQQARGPARPPRGRGVDSTRVSLFTYPVLMAADILLYRPTEVPVGADQRQHVELTRDLAVRFNNTYGAVFTVPTVVTPAAGARVMDLSDPTRKMSKSADAAGSVFLLDPPDVVRRKIARAVTDSDTGADAVRADPTKPGVTNLLEILTACGGSAAGLTTYGALKRTVTDAVVAELEPVQKAYAELAADLVHVETVYAAGAQRCREVTAPVLAAARAAMGL